MTERRISTSSSISSTFVRSSLTATSKSHWLLFGNNSPSIGSIRSLCLGSYFEFAEARQAMRAAQPFLLDVGRLSDRQTVTQRFGSGLYDEFHTWVFDAASLPAGRNRLRFESTGVNDIDIFVRYAQPAQYSVDLKPDVELSEGSPEPFYFVNVPEAQRGDRVRNGNETVLIDNPQTGSYYVTVVNFDRTDGATYTLRASVETSVTGPDDGGGALSPTLLALLLGGLLARTAAPRLARRIGACRQGLPGPAKA